MNQDSKKRPLSKTIVNQQTIEHQTLNKKVKIEQIDIERMQVLSENLEQKFTLQQIETLTQSVISLSDYLKIASIDIQHQQRSISTLPLLLIQQYSQLKTRVSTLMSKCQFNMQFINRLIYPYKPLLFKKVQIQNNSKKQKRQLQQNNHQHQHQHQHLHSHSHHQQSYQTVLNIFHGLVREWSSTSQINHIKKIITNIKQNWVFQKEQSTSVLIVGCGMGRIIYELSKQFQKSNLKIQGHESQIQLYLCAEYFLQRCHQQLQIYPYIHNFNNFLSVLDPYRQIKIPFQIKTKNNFFPLTLGKFTKLYRSHFQNWNIIVTVFANQHVEDIIIQIKTIYRILKQGGLWIDLCTSNFLSNVLPLTYRQYEDILNKSQFKLLSQQKSNESWYYDKNSIMNQYRISHYRVMQK